MLRYKTLLFTLAFTTAQVPWRCCSQGCECCHRHHQDQAHHPVCWLVPNWLQGLCSDAPFSCSIKNLNKSQLNCEYWIVMIGNNNNTNLSRYLFQGWHQLPATNSCPWRRPCQGSKSCLHALQHHCHCRGLGPSGPQVWPGIRIILIRINWECLSDWLILFSGLSRW